MQTNDGLTLDRYLSEKGPLTPPQAAKVVLQVAQQMAGAGGSFLIHPGRILAGRDGSVRLLPPPAEELGLPTIVEFPAYASPEEIRGGTPDLRSGFYSLGCTLFELLAGTPPYLSRNPKETLRGHLEGPIPDVREHAAGVPNALAETLHELLAKDPELRIQTQAELIRRLKQALVPGAGAVSATPPRPPPARQEAAAGRRPAPHTSAAAGLNRPAGVAAARQAGARRKPTLGGRGAAAARRRPGFPGGGQPRLGRGGRAGAGAGRAGRHDELDEEEVQTAPEPRKRTFPCSILGGVLGVALGILVVMRLSRESDARLKNEKKLVSESVATESARIVQTRIDEYRNGVEKRRADARKRLENIRKMASPGDRKESLLQALSFYCDSAAGPELAEELVKVWPEALAGPQADIKEAEAGFAKHREEANKLYGEGKIGDAIRRIREAESDFSKTHGKEIDELLTRWSDEITAKWERDKARAERLGRDGDAEGAVKVMREAMEYGDGQVKRDAEKTITTIQSQALISSRQNKRAAKAADEDGKAKEDDASDLEEEFRDEDGAPEENKKGDGKAKEEKKE